MSWLTLTVTIAATTWLTIALIATHELRRSMHDMKNDLDTRNPPTTPKRGNP